ncbi:unnamed protein product [Camellia sinensis]
MAFQSHIQLSCLSIITFYILLATPCATALNFTLDKIDPKNLNVDITTDGDAYISSEGINLAAAENDTNLQQRAGKATYVEQLHLWDKVSGNLTDFTTYFSFVIDSNGSSSFGDGLAFFLAPSGSSTTAGGAIGLPIHPQTLEPTSPFVAVEFDTFQNTWDPQNITPATHVGININSIKSNDTATWTNNVTYGMENEAWIEYVSKSKMLCVVFTDSMNNYTIQHGLHFKVDLRDYLPEWVTFGFSASTGAFFEKNIVKSWRFNSGFPI